jgi:murein DD-endopeptidase MepM/ murein hydrolase activator NlpD
MPPQDPSIARSGAATTIIVVRRGRRRRVRPARSGPARWRALLAITAATLLIAPYATAPYLSALPLAQASETTEEKSARPNQALSVSTDALEADAASRGDFTVILDVPGKFTPYARTADTFVNNPNSPVQWPFTRGVPIHTWFSVSHLGLDMNPGIGTPVQAIADGVVVETGNPSGTYGVHAVIEHVVDGQKVTSLYGHMLEGSLAVSVGDVVTVGQLVGQVGSSGASTGPHLHFSIYVDGTAADPYAWLKRTVAPLT